MTIHGMAWINRGESKPAAWVERQSAIAATVESYRDHLIPAETARVILRGLGASEATVRTLAHNQEGRR